MDKDYIDQMKKIYTIKQSDVTALDWFLLLVGGAATILCTAAFVYWIIKIIIFLINVRKAKASINDVRFWKRMIISLFIIFLFMSGTLLLVFEKLTNFLQIMGWNVK
ncbi:hypothetical protein [Paenibacillus sp. FSL L8-0494]|uniref:hypothetical protein n=1 Tax=Paenibacillus sp. FSL L8-0494 TaxID=2975352 RepID=UPI0030F7375D